MSRFRPALPTLLSAVLILATPAVSLQARENYNRIFWKAYKKEIGKFAETTRCNACHYGPEKKNRNDYGQKFGEVLIGRGVTDADEIREALEETAQEESGAKGKTFGDLIKSGKLPGKRPDN